MKTTRLALALSLVVATAQATVLYDQPVLWNGQPTGNVGGGWGSTLTSPGSSGFRTFDTFSLGSAATINQATWYGVYLAGSGLPYANAAPNTITWSIDILANAAGIPGASLSNTTLAAGAVTQSLLGTGLFGGTSVNVYQFTANLTSFNAAAGTTYWFSPVSLSTASDPHFSWIQGTGPDSSSFQQFISGGVVQSGFVRNSDRAFSLSSVSNVPDAGSTATFFAVALAALALLRRRLADPALV